MANIYDAGSRRGQWQPEAGNFIFYKPCGLLRPYVRYYWIFKSCQQLNTFTFPVGCPQLIFHKRTPLYIPELDTVQDRLTVSGQVNFSSHLCTSGETEMIVTVFRPQAISAFLHVPASVFYNQEVSGYSLGNRSLNELADRIFGCADNEACISRIENWLLSRLAASPDGIIYNTKRMDAAVKKIFAAPQTSVTELSSITCLSRKQFGRLFNSFVGIGPKEYACIVRFLKALALMQRNAGEINMAQMACACGYSDQSHLIREFRRFCGHTPLSLPESAEPCSDLFAVPV